MAVLSIFSSAFNCKLPSNSNSIYSSLNLSVAHPIISVEGISSDKGQPNSSRVGVVSSHSNPMIIKSNRKSRYGQPISPYDTEDGDDDAREEDQDDDDDDWFSDDPLSEDKDSEADRQKLKLQKMSNVRQGRRRYSAEWSIRPLNSRKSLEMTPDKLGQKTGRNALDRRNGGGYVSLLAGDSGEKETRCCAKNKYERLSEELDLDEGWIPLLDYLSTFGLKESHFIQMYERHMPSLQINVFSAQERLDFLLSVGVKHRDIKKIILRQPQILEYTVENNLKSHVAFLASLDIPDSKIGRIIAATPSLFSYSVENSLKPTVRYLLEEVGIKKNDLSKVVQLSPQILVQRIESSWNTRLNFLTKELGAPRDSIVKMITKHPQFLHYSIEDGLLPRINFLRSIGLRNSDILKVLTRLTQVLSLSLEENLKPKYMYLINELRNEAHSLTKYPMYLSLSLDQRIRPRHRFLVSLKKAPKGPFPLSSLVPTDECFCQQWARTSVDTYLDFRQKLLLKEFAKKYERQ